jgi:hypothetical protein
MTIRPRGSTQSLLHCAHRSNYLFICLFIFSGPVAQRGLRAMGLFGEVEHTGTVNCCDVQL